MDKTERVSDGLLPQRRLYSFLFGRHMRPLPSPEERKPYPYVRVNYFSQAIFWWLLPVMKTGYARTLQPEDFWYLGEELQVDTMYQAFKLNMNKRVQKSVEIHREKIEALKEKNAYNSDEDEGPSYPKHSVSLALWDTFKWEYTFSIVCSALNSMSLTFNPLVARALINYVEKKSLYPSTPLNEGIAYALTTTILVIVNGVLVNHYFHSGAMVGAKVKAVLTKAMLEKSFKLNALSMHNFPMGKITSIMATDLSRIDLAVGFQPFVVGFVFAVIVAIILLIVNLGVSALTGLAVFITALSLIFYFTRRLFRYRKIIVRYTDERVSAIKEILSNMKIIKYYSWEVPYFNKVKDARTKEMHFISKMQFMRAIITSIAVSLPQLSSMVSFLVMYAIRGSKNAGDIFSSLSLFNILSQQAMNMPLILAMGADALVGITRVKDFLQSGENDAEAIVDVFENVETLKEDKIAIKVEHASFKWRTFDTSCEDQSPQKGDRSISDRTQKSDAKAKNFVPGMKFPGLLDVTVDIKQNEFMVITGSIGSGKSSLLQAFANTMHRESGLMKINGSILLCAQPWVQNATIKENIIFGNKFDQRRYDETLEACCLLPDLEVFPAGDATEVGERGITLSGGQKARISLARAIYDDNDIILLDDVLSAVDAKVGKDIVDKCILGLLKDKTRILATHQLSLINSADRVIFLKGDGSTVVGTIEELKSNQAFSDLMSYSVTKTEEEDDEIAEEEQATEKERETKSASQASVKVDGRIIQKETRAVNSIKLDVYKKYVQLGSGILRHAFFPLFTAVVVVATTAQVFTNVWLSFWAGERFQRSESFYIGIYVMLSFLTVILVAIQFCLLVYSATRASRALNIKAAEQMLKVPMAYIDVTPIGRVLNRFTKDTDSMDNELIEQLRLVIYQAFMIFAIIIMCIVYLPWFALAVPFLILAFHMMANFYQASSLEVKRLESVQRSLVYNNFNETLTGMATIQSYGREQMFLERNSRQTDCMNEAYFITTAAQRWLGLNLALVSASFTLLITMLSVTRQFKISASSTGLLVSYVLQVSGQLSFLIRSATRVEIDMNSTERLYEYAYELPSEAPMEISETKPRASWPESGSISFKGVSLSYRPGLPLVLKNLSFEVGGNEKIAICGRTGAGKSSIMTALWRLTELQSGVLSIDGVDISTIGLHDLRSKLSIIPQDPVLFKGTVRSNLDPFKDYSDEVLWDAMRRSSLVDANQIDEVKNNTLSHKFHLDQVVEEDGLNYSMGEKQLIALARAVVRNSKILVLDEATSSVDYETDAKIQASITREFGDRTILCIAHRLKTIINYDRIIVLEAGEIAECDSPWNLFNSDGIFRQMCKKSDITEMDFQKR